MEDHDPAAFAARLTHVASERDIAVLAFDTEGVLVTGLDDSTLQLLAARAPRLLHILSDGNCRVTDAGLAALSAFTSLESLDLEYGAVTDAGLARLAALRTLRWIDLGGCVGVTAAGLAAFRRARPDVEIEPPAG